MSERHPSTNAIRKPKPSAGITMRAIRRYARQLAERFRPEKIILFGSYAYGEPNADSDVDLLVVMPGRNQLDQAGKIYLEIPAPFPLDLIVRTPRKLNQRLANGDLFTTYIMSNGKVLYEAVHGRMGAKSRSRPRSRKARRPRQNSAS
jgi:predicted nucleotidyltransferase